MSICEFSACQKLLGGYRRRWPSILVELGSINLNMSSEETTRLICELAVQAGPREDGNKQKVEQRKQQRQQQQQKQQGHDEWRTVHAVFREEPAFVERLLEQIERRLGHISSN
jgi:hypothetical protein